MSGSVPPGPFAGAPGPGASAAARAGSTEAASDAACVVLREGAAPESPRAAPLKRRKASALPHAAAGCGSSIRRGSSVSRAMTRRWICDVPS